MSNDQTLYMFETLALLLNFIPTVPYYYIGYLNVNMFCSLLKVEGGPHYRLYWGFDLSSW